MKAHRTESPANRSILRTVSDGNWTVADMPFALGARLLIYHTHIHAHARESSPSQALGDGAFSAGTRRLRGVSTSSRARARTRLREPPTLSTATRERGPVARQAADGPMSWLAGLRGSPRLSRELQHAWHISGGAVKYRL